MPFTEVFEPFFNTAEFATTAVLNGSTNIDGILDNNYFEAFGDNVTQGSAPTFLCEHADISSVAQGDTLVCGSTYKVRGVEPDGTGLVLLRLEKQ